MGTIPASKVSQVSALLAAGGVVTMATGNMGNAFKFFMYATETAPSQGLHLIMLMVAKNGKVQGTVKSCGGSKDAFLKHLESLLSQQVHIFDLTHLSLFFFLRSSFGPC